MKLYQAVKLHANFTLIIITLGCERHFRHEMPFNIVIKNFISNVLRFVLHIRYRNFGRIT